jgi:hypothetical protein
MSYEAFLETKNPIADAWRRLEPLMYVHRSEGPPPTAIPIC